jgi:hypothetical protein
MIRLDETRLPVDTRGLKEKIDDAIAAQRALTAALKDALYLYIKQ